MFVCFGVFLLLAVVLEGLHHLTLLVLFFKFCSPDLIMASSSPFMLLTILSVKQSFILSGAYCPDVLVDSYPIQHSFCQSRQGNFCSLLVSSHKTGSQLFFCTCCSLNSYVLDIHEKKCTQCFDEISLMLCPVALVVCVCLHWKYRF